MGDASINDDGTLSFTPSLEIGENGLYILGHHATPVDTVLAF